MDYDFEETSSLSASAVPREDCKNMAEQNALSLAGSFSCPVEAFPEAALALPSWGVESRSDKQRNFRLGWPHCRAQGKSINLMVSTSPSVEGG